MSGESVRPTSAELEKRHARQGQSYTAIVWAQLKRNRAGMAGLAFIVVLVVTALFAPLLANDRPVAIRWQGGTYFPAFRTYVDIWVPWGSLRDTIKSWKMSDDPPYFPFSDKYPELGNRTWRDVLASGDGVSWSLSPPVPWNPQQFDATAIKKSPSTSSGHYLGTDDQGRDVLARIVHGTVVAVTVGVVSMSIAGFIGIVLGVMAGYFGGLIDLVFSRITEVFICFPAFFMIIAVVSFLQPSIINIMIVIGLFGWTGIYRLIRGEVLRVKSLDYVMAARALGIPTRRLMFRQILPNAVAPVFVSIAFGIAGAVLTETSLSFLGFGDTSVPSWGEIVSQGRNYVIEGLTHLIVWPGLAIFLTLTAFNLFGQGLRDAMDPRLRR